MKRWIPLLLLTLLLPAAALADALTPYTLSVRLQTFAPTAPTVPIGVYKDTACTQPATNYGDVVMGWKDVLGASGLILTASSTATAPTLVYVNSYPVLRFNGTTTQMSTAWTADLTGGVALTVTARKTLSINNDTSQRVLARLYPSNAIGIQFQPSNGTTVGGGVTAFSNAKSDSSGPLEEWNWHVDSCVVTSSTLQLFRDGAALAASVATTSTIPATTSGQTLWLGTDAGSGNHGDYDISSVMISSNANQSALESYQIANKPVSYWTFTATAINKGTQSWEANAVQEMKPVQLPNGTYVSTYTGGWGTASIGWATSTNGTTWTKAANPIFGNGYGGESASCRQSNLFLVGTTLYCYYATGTDLHQQTSTNYGATWSGPSTILAQSAGPSGIVGWKNSSVCIVNGVWHLFVEGDTGSGARYFTYHATSTNGGTSYGVPTGPITGLQHGSGMYGGPNVQYLGSRWHIIYHGASSGSLPTDGYQAYTDSVTPDQTATWVQQPELILRRNDSPASLDINPINQIADIRPLGVANNNAAFLVASQVDNSNQTAEILSATPNYPVYPVAEPTGLLGTPDNILGQAAINASVSALFAAQPAYSVYGNFTGASAAATFSAAPPISGANLTALPTNTALYPSLNQNTTGSAASFTGALAGDVTGTQGATTVAKLNGVALSGLSGILYDSAGTVSTATSTQVQNVLGANAYQPYSPVTGIPLGTGSGAYGTLSIGAGLSLSSGTLTATGGGGGGGGGTVTSVGLALPSIFSVTNSPVTGSGTLTGALTSEPAYSLFGNFTNASAVPGFSQAPAFSGLNLTALPSTTSLYPTLNQSTTGNAATATIATSATNLAGGTAGQVPYQTGAGATGFETTVPITQGGTGATTASAALSSLGAQPAQVIQVYSTTNSSTATVTPNATTVIIGAAQTVAPTFTLNSAASYPAGSIVTFIDPADYTVNYTVSVIRSGTDTVNGSATSITTLYGTGITRFVTDGVSKWQQDYIVGALSGLSTIGTSMTVRLGGMKGAAAFTIGPASTASAYSFIPTTNGTLNLGSSSASWGTLYSTAQIGGQSVMTSNATGTITFNALGESETQYNTGTTTIASGTITLPTTSQPGQTVSYDGAAAITTVTMAGGTVDIGIAPTSYAANSVLSWQSDVSGHWIRKQ